MTRAAPARARERERERGHEQEEKAHTESPDHDRVAPDRQPEAERDTQREQHREQVPDANGIAQTCPPRAVLEQRRVDLPRERPDQGGGDDENGQSREHCRCAPHERAEEQPQHEQGEIRDAAVEVAPREIGSERP